MSFKNVFFLINNSWNFLLSHSNSLHNVFLVLFLLYFMQILWLVISCRGLWGFLKLWEMPTSPLSFTYLLNQKLIFSSINTFFSLRFNIILSSHWISVSFFLLFIVYVIRLSVFFFVFFRLKEWKRIFLFGLFSKNR